MASGSSGSKGFDFASDDILCSYEDYVNHESSNGSHSDPSVGANANKLQDLNVGHSTTGLANRKNGTKMVYGAGNVDDMFGIKKTICPKARVNHMMTNYDKNNDILGIKRPTDPKASAILRRNDDDLCGIKSAINPKARIINMKKNANDFCGLKYNSNKYKGLIKGNAANVGRVMGLHCSML